DSIQVLEGLEAVRKRPAMYIGDIGIKGLHHLVYEVVDNSIDEALAGYCKTIQVTINEDNSITVQDDGRGIPTGMHTKENRSALEVVMTVLHAGGKFDKGSYKVSGGLHGVGVSCVNALSTTLHVTVNREGKTFEQTYHEGKPEYPVRQIGESDTTGTRVQFWPDGSIFQHLIYNKDILEGRLRELSFLNRGIRITLTDVREKTDDGQDYTKEFYSEGGIVEFVQMLDTAANRTSLLPTVVYCEARDEKSNVMVEVAMNYNHGYSEHILGLAVNGYTSRLIHYKISRNHARAYISLKYHFTDPRLSKEEMEALKKDAERARSFPYIEYTADLVCLDVEKKCISGSGSISKDKVIKALPPTPSKSPTIAEECLKDELIMMKTGLRGVIRD
ncbi:MAG: hypothetical protein EOP04_10140, partial [Proteobacteria bacterium]